MTDIHDPLQPLDLHAIGCCALAFVLNEQQILREIKSDLDDTCRSSFTGQLNRHLAFRPLSASMSIDHAASDWQDLVYQFDYFDQTHFIKEFKSFFGHSPAKAHLSSQNLARTASAGS